MFGNLLLLVVVVLVVGGEESPLAASTCTLAKVRGFCALLRLRSLACSCSTHRSMSNDDDAVNCFFSDGLFLLVDGLASLARFLVRVGFDVCKARLCESLLAAGTTPVDFAPRLPLSFLPVSLCILCFMSSESGVVASMLALGDVFCWGAATEPMASRLPKVSASFLYVCLLNMAECGRTPLSSSATIRRPMTSCRRYPRAAAAGSRCGCCYRSLLTPPPAQAAG